MKLLLFDLDGTLLQSDKTISPRTLHALQRCRAQGMLVGISTSRAQQNCMTFLPHLQPDVFIASGGAVVKYRGKYLFTAEFSVCQTRDMIAAARDICGADCEMTIDTLCAHYWNYKTDPNRRDATWGDTVYTDFSDYREKALKFCAQVFDPTRAAQLSARLSACDCHRFTGSAWYKFTRKDATKEHAIEVLCSAAGIAPQDITAFGDDAPDIGMLTLCGTGVAMGNAIAAVKQAADITIGSNDSEGIAQYLEQRVL